MNVLLILNDPAYGTERSYNGLRLAGALARRDDARVRVFLIGDAVGCAMAEQKVPNGGLRCFTRRSSNWTRPTAPTGRRG